MMTHSDPDALAMMAMGESELPEAELRHLQECADCRSDLRSLRRVAEIARSGRVDESLVRPDARVWARIAAETGIAAPLAERVDTASAATAAVTPRRKRPVARVALLAGAAALVLIATITTTVVLVQREQPLQIGQAVLDPLPDAPGAGEPGAGEPGVGEPGVRGLATVEQRDDGIRDVTVSVTVDESSATVSPDSFREVWLLSPDLDRLVSLGVLDGREGRYAIPEGVDLAEFPVVDISLEPLDGDPQHSGESIVRGTLTT